MTHDQKEKVFHETAQNGKPRLSRRQMLRSVWFAAAGAAIFGESFVREIHQITLEKVDVVLPGFESEFTLALISDLHYTGSRVPCESLAKKINAQKPDAVAIVGDLVSNFDGRQQVKTLLELLAAPTFVVPGNWEHFLGWRGDELRKFYDKQGAQLLDNRRTLLPVGGGLQIAGVDDPYIGNDDLETALKHHDKKKPTVLLAHSPLIARRAAALGVDLILSGHTHGGQLRLPFWGALYLPPGSAGYQMGMYEVGGKKLYITRGIGTCMLPARLFCTPEITLLRIVGA